MMKKSLPIILIVVLFTFSGCGEKAKTPIINQEGVAAQTTALITTTTQNDTKPTSTAQKSPLVNGFFSTEDFDRVVIGETTLEDMRQMFSVTHVNLALTSYGLRAEFPMKDDKAMCIRYHAPDMIVMDISVVKFESVENQAEDVTPLVSFCEIHESLMIEDYDIEFPIDVDHIMYFNEIDTIQSIPYAIEVCLKMLDEFQKTGDLYDYIPANIGHYTDNNVWCFCYWNKYELTSESGGVHVAIDGNTGALIQVWNDGE